MPIDAREYLKNIDYSHRNKIPYDLLLCLAPFPIILNEKEGILRFTPLKIESSKSFITQIRFWIQVTDPIGNVIIKNVYVTSKGDSKERIAKIDTLLSETPLDTTCLITIDAISTRYKIAEKKIEVNDNIEISGLLLSSVNEIPLSNQGFIIAIAQKQRHEINSHILECTTSESGTFETTFSRNDLERKSEPFWISCYNKISEAVSVDFDYMNSHHREKVALIAAIFVDHINS